MADDFSLLCASVTSLKLLVQAFEKALESPISSSPPHPRTSNPLNALALLADASSILKAQTTKLSLLIVNKPFAPTAITSILNSLSHECLPSLMSAFELCPPYQYSQLLNQATRSLLIRAFGGLRAIISVIPQNEECINRVPKDRVLSLTGALWETCDNMAEVASNGLIGLATRKIETYHELFKDAVEELAQWDPNEETEDDGSSSDDLTLTPTPPISPISELQKPIKSTQSKIILLCAQTLSLLRHIRLLYPALKKRRILTFPPITSRSFKPLPDQPSNKTPSTFPSPSQIAIFNNLIKSLLVFSEQADEVAEALYAQNAREVKKHLMNMKKFSADVVYEARLDWDSNEDIFSEWIDRWRERLDKIDIGEDANMNNVENKRLSNEISFPNANEKAQIPSPSSAI